MLWVELITFFQPERNIKQSIKWKVKYEIFSGAETQKIITFYLLETSWITVELYMKRFLIY